MSSVEGMLVDGAVHPVEFVLDNWIPNFHFHSSYGSGHRSV
jgi:hypothetical protein